MKINTMKVYNKNRTISVIITLFTFLTLIFCCSHICEAAGTKLVWDESPESNVAGYYIYYGTEPGIYTNSVQVVGKRSNIGYLIENLRFTPDQAYYIAVTAYTDTGESTYSNEVIYNDSGEESTYSNEVIYNDYSLIPQSQLTIASVDSEELVGEDGAAENAIDGVTSTFWHTEWYRSECPHEIVIDIGDIYLVGGFQYLPRQDGHINGTVAEYSIYVSEDGITWGEAVATGTFAGDTTEKEVTLTGKIGRYVRFVAMSEVNGNPWTTAAEINILGTILPADSDGDGIIDDDEIDIYGTDLDKADTDGDGINDGKEVILWGDGWNADYDGDGIINILDPDTPDYSLIPQSQLTIVSVDSEELVAEDGAVENAIDGVTSTFWHTEWYRSDPVCPHEIVIHLGDIYLVGGLQYLPRQDEDKNGTVAEYSIYVSEDGITWGEAVATGTFAGDTTEKEVTLTGKIGRYVRFVAMSEVNGNPWTSAAEINILGNILLY